MLKLLTIIGVFILTNFLRALVLVKLWEWFIMPTFLSTPRLSYATAFGMAILLSYAVNPNPTASTKENEGKSFAEIVGTALLTPLVVLFFGWLTTQFM